MMYKLHPSTHFGPVTISYEKTENLNPQQLRKYKKEVQSMEQMKKEGYSRIKNVIRVIRREFEKAVNIGSRSSSSKLLELAGIFDTMKEIWQEYQADDAICNSMHPCRRRK